MFHRSREYLRSDSLEQLAARARVEREIREALDAHPHTKMIATAVESGREYMTTINAAACRQILGIDLLEAADVAFYWKEKHLAQAVEYFSRQMPGSWSYRAGPAMSILSRDLIEGELAANPDFEQRLLERMGLPNAYAAAKVIHVLTAGLKTNVDLLIEEGLYGKTLVYEERDGRPSQLVGFNWVAYLPSRGQAVCTSAIDDSLVNWHSVTSFEEALELTSVEHSDEPDSISPRP